METTTIKLDEARLKTTQDKLDKLMGICNYPKGINDPKYVLNAFNYLVTYIDSYNVYEKAFKILYKQDEQNPIWEWLLNELDNIQKNNFMYTTKDIFESEEE